MAESKNRKEVLFVLVFVLVTFTIYGKILGGFFQQDEWATFGAYITHRNDSLASILRYIFALSVGHYNPLTNLVQFTMFKLWGVNYIKFAFFGIVLHIANGIGIYLLARRIFKKNIFLAFLTSISFLLFAASYQGVSWVLVNTATLSASLFGIVSAIFFYDFMESRKRKLLFYSILFLIISVLFKEITVGLFPFYFFVLFVIAKNEIIYVFIPGIIYFLFRASMFFSPDISTNSIVTKTQSLTYLISNFFTLPFKSLSQILLPEGAMIGFSRLISIIFLRGLAPRFGTTAFDLFILNRVVAPISIIAGLFVILFSLFLYFKKADLRIVIILSVAWCFCNSLIFAFAPETTGITILVDSRNLYFSSIGVAFLVIAFLKTLKLDNKKLVLLLLPIIFLNVYFLNQKLSQLVSIGSLRKNILNQISAEEPKLGMKTVFYVESDTSYYGLPPEIKIPPFQSGFGQTLLVWYDSRQSFPHSFFENDFLWPIDSEGYKDVNGIGFGYFRNFDDLANFFKYNKSTGIQIVAYKFNSKINKLDNISSDIIASIQRKHL